VKINADKGVSSAALTATRAAANADTASKSAIAPAAAGQSVVFETMRLTAIKKETASKTTASQGLTASMCTLPQGLHLKTTATCPASPEHIRLYYDVRSSRQYPHISVPSCIATTRIQSTNYPSAPSSWPKQQLFDDHSNVIYVEKEQSPVYDTLATKNWTVVTTTWSTHP